jgi:hypothetical protein
VRERERERERNKIYMYRNSSQGKRKWTVAGDAIINTIGE